MRAALSLSLCFLFAAGALGCAQNAILELQVQLPANPPGETWFAQVQVRAAPTRDPLSNFGINWMGNDLRTVPLTSVVQWSCLSVESQDPTLSLLVKVRFCRAENCLDLVDGDPPERLYSLETPFYIGQRTYHRIIVTGIPVCSSTAACAVSGEGTVGVVGVCIDEHCACSVDSDCASGFACVTGVGCAQLVDRCQIEGCVAGSTTSCSEGEHFCEIRPGDPPAMDFRFMCGGGR